MLLPANLAVKARDLIFYMLAVIKIPVSRHKTVISSMQIVLGILVVIAKAAMWSVIDPAKAKRVDETTRLVVSTSQLTFPQI